MKEFTHTMKIPKERIGVLIGKEGEIREVSTGYARNFLIPQGFADVATPDLIAQIEKRTKKEAKRAEMDLVKTESLASQLDGSEFEISAKVSDMGTLYAAIAPSKIASLLKTKGFEVSKDQIITPPIKETGEHEIVIKLDHGLETKIVLIVNPSKDND